MGWAVLKQKTVKIGYQLVKGRFQKYEEIPNDWIWTSIGKECKLTSGSTPSREHPEFFDGKILWVNSSELDYNIIEETEQHITDPAVKEAQLQIHPPGTFLIAITGLEALGTRGRCAILGKEATTNQSCMAFYPSEKLISNFLYYHYQFFGESIISQLAQGTKQQSLNGKLVKSIPIAIPPTTTEQEKIVSILSNIDELIKKQQQLIDESQKLKNGEMQKLLFSGIGNEKKKSQTIKTRFKENIKIPSTWKYKPLGNVVKILSGHYFPFSEFSEKGTPVLKIDNVMYGNMEWDNVTFLDQKHIKKYEELLLKENDIVLALNRPITNNQVKVSRIQKEDIPTILYQRVGKFIFTDKTMDMMFFYQFLRGGFFKNFLSRILIGTDQPYVKTTELLRQEFPYPSDNEEQKKIGLILSNLDLLIENEKQYKAKLEKIKRGLMQQLLTGQKRVKI